jgi:hypothetical protein
MASGAGTVAGCSGGRRSQAIEVQAQGLRCGGTSNAAYESPGKENMSPPSLAFESPHCSQYRLASLLERSPVKSSGVSPFRKKPKGVSTLLDFTNFQTAAPQEEWGKPSRRWTLAKTLGLNNGIEAVYKSDLEQLPLRS